MSDNNFPLISVSKNEIGSGIERGAFLLAPIRIDTSSRWPTSFPTNCPPSEGRSSAMEAFRLLEANPPSPDDFRSHKELGVPFGKTKECQACGLSIFTDLEDVHVMLKRVPKLRKKLKYVAKGTISSDSGVVVQTPENYRSHYTWWTYVDVNALGAFAISGVSPL